MSEPSDDDKQHDPTQKRLEDARKKGEIPRSADLTAALAYGGFYLAAITVGANSLIHLGAPLARLISDAPALAHEVFSGGGAAVARSIAAAVIIALAPWFLFPVAAALLSIVAQRALVFAPSKLALKISRVSPLSNAKHKFGRQGLFDFAKSLTKLVAYSLVLGVFLKGQAEKLVFSPGADARHVVAYLFTACAGFLLVVVIVSLVVGALDLGWQHAEHLRKNRMSRKELTDETKEMEGDPQMRQQRRQKAQEIALNKMLADVPDADVVIVNPTHFAVALKWSRAPGSAPVCVAKGADEIAARIREAAVAAGVPIQRDPITARTLYASLRIGDEIWPEHYKAVATAIRFAEKMRRMAGKRPPR